MTPELIRFLGLIRAVPAALGEVLLALTRPDWRAVWNTPRVEHFQRPDGFAATLLGAGLILVVLLGASTALYGSPAAAIARLRGDPLYSPGYLDFGTGQPGELLEREVPVTNGTARPIRPIGGTSDCSCITTANMPLTIAPGEMVAVPVSLQVPGSASGAFIRRVELWTDCDQRRKIGFTIGCRVE